MAKVIETTKGVFLVVEKWELKFKEKRGILHVYHHNCLVDWIHRIKPYEITEEQAIGIVEETNDIQPNTYKYYGFYDQIFFKAIDSLNSLLELHNIEINENTYIFKL